MFKFKYGILMVIPLLFGLCLSAQAALTTSYRVQLSVVGSEADAQQLVNSLSAQTQLPIEVLPYLR